MKTIHPIGCAVHCEYRVYRMILRPRVAPMYVKARAANGTVTAAARNAGVATDSLPLNVRASQGAAANTSTANGTETAVAISPARRTSVRLRAASSRPTRIATSRTFATSMPKRVAAAAMNANCVVSVTMPNDRSPNRRVMITCAAKVAAAPIASPSTFCPVLLRITRWSEPCTPAATGSASVTSTASSVTSGSMTGQVSRTELPRTVRKVWRPDGSHL